MDPELKKALDELRGQLGKNVEAVARIDAIEQAGIKREADVKTLRGELDTVKAAHIERETIIRDLQAQGRIVRMAADPIRDMTQAKATLGMIVRAELSRHLRVEIPSVFSGEAEQLKLYREKIQRATLSSIATPGTYLVPSITESSVIDTLEEISDLLSRVDMITGLPAASTIYLPTLTGRPTLQPARAASDTKMTQSDPTFGQTSIAPQEAYIYFPVDNRLIQMSAVALGGLILQVLRDGIAGGMCDWLLNGTGAAAYNSITGILQEATYVNSLPAGKTKFTDLTKTDLTAIKAAVLKRGRAKGVWLTSFEILGLFEEMDRTGKVPVITYGQDGAARALQNPVVIDEGMPDLADTGVGKALLGFGDLSAYLVGLIGGIQIASSADYLFGNNQTAFRGVVNMDIKRKPVNTFRTLKTAAV